MYKENTENEQPLTQLFSFSLERMLKYVQQETKRNENSRLGLKGNRPIKYTIEFLLKLHIVMECYMLSEKVK